MKYLKAFFILFSIAIGLIIVCNVWVSQETEEYIFTNSQTVTSRPTGLVLGTSKRVRDGNENLFFKYRIAAAAQLFQEGKIKHLILSGDNSSRYYNEPSDMKNALMLLGIPENAMTLDYAGQNTFQSVVRCHQLYNRDSVIVISQAFHGARAVFIARHYKFPFIAYAAQDVPWQASIQTRFREYLARPKAILDIYLLQKEETVFDNESE
ncbi:ElyC/SanA/YdcF family protein [Cytophagaceae bacterium DM2B3-1]|uniref:ElyC/SanA/YdcF family protein n=1 Tax=Xanthocytophaga flava TaxID=3048013 RepID=A0ABT7CJP3_9BACT|nr:ElyC/SanA/YdcF family protein [Xanthocytophaga flavus]MDJ1467873.1 ElyC/SanA/YdcF family protein [Xanthocytophaga flavus]MDJ1493951.1 ElyC/SanA/YdcF family protein [Xanthocytophaga flavus]